MKLKLGDKTYHSKELVFGDLYEANEFLKYFNDGGSNGKDMIEEFDTIANYLVRLFRDQFTVDDVYKKLPNRNSIITVMKLAEEVKNEAVADIAPKNDKAIAAKKES